LLDLVVIVKHLLIRPKNELQIDGVVRTPNDSVAHIITDVDIFTLASMITFGRVLIDVRDDDTDDAELPEPTGSQIGGEEPVAAADAVAPVPSAAETETNDGSDQLDLVAYYVESGISEAVAEALAEVVFEPNDVPDRDQLRTVEGIREWAEKHKDLTALPKIGKTRAADILKAIAAK
jgi:hypothetical protein